MIRLEGSLGSPLKPVSPKTKTVSQPRDSPQQPSSFDFSRTKPRSDIKLDLFDDETDRAALPDAVALSLGRRGNRSDGLDRLTVLVGYFFIWTVFGIVAFALGVAPAEIEMALAS